MTLNVSCIPRFVRRCKYVVVIALAIVLLASLGPAVHAAPAPAQSARIESEQIPNWMSAETASRLAIGIDVLAPSYVPAPFGGEPEVQAYDGYYSLYWFIPGAPPTYLRVTGEYGGFIPDFSYYDRNIQLEVNADVMGYPAYRDISPIYDVVYWQVGEVVYTIESHNLVSDDSLGLANSLMYVSAPAVEEEPVEPEPTTAPAPRSFTIGVPASVQSGEVTTIGVDGTGDYLLSSDDGYFPATGENTVVVTESISIEWVAPYYESDQLIGFYVYDLESGETLASGQTALEGYLSVGEVLSADIQCPVEASVGKEARILLSGNGTLIATTTDGTWPAETPNLDFQPDADGGNALVGTLVEGSSVALSWLAPEVPLTAYISVNDLDGNLLDECGIEIVETAVSGNLGGPAAESSGLPPGDGTGVENVDQGVVLRAIANPTGFSGDASGGPEANGPDYGLETATTAEDADQLAASNLTNAGSSEDASASDSEGLGPATGADGLVALTMGVGGGMLENEAGCHLFVPSGALSDQVTVMIKPVEDHELPDVGSVTFVEGTAFDVAFSQSDGQAVPELQLPATLSIALRSAPSGQGARIYEIDGSTVRPMSVVNEENGAVSTEVTMMSRYVVGVPAAVAAGSTNSMNRYLIGGLGALALVSAAYLFSRGLQRRRTRVVPVRRHAFNPRVRYR